MWGENRFSYPMYRDFRDHNSVFEGVAARFPTALNLTLQQSQRTHPGRTGFRHLVRHARPHHRSGPRHHRQRRPRSRRSSRRGPHLRLLEVPLQRQPRHPQSDRAAQWSPHDGGRCHRARLSRLRPRRARRCPRAHHDEGRDDPHLERPSATGAPSGCNSWATFAPASPQRQAQASLEPYYHGLLIMEMQTMKFRTERSRSGFATKPLIFVPAGKGVSDLARTVLRSAAHPARHRRPVAAHRLRQRREPSSGARRRPAEGDRDPPGRGRQPFPVGPPVDCGEPGPLPRRRRHRDSLRVVDRQRPAQPAGEFRRTFRSPLLQTCASLPSPSRSLFSPACSLAWLPPGRPPRRNSPSR